MSAKRKNVSLSHQLEARAKDIIKARGFDGLSDMVQTLIREEYERRHAPHILQEQPAPYGKPSSVQQAAAELLEVGGKAIVAARPPEPPHEEQPRIAPIDSQAPDAPVPKEHPPTSAKRKTKHSNHS